MSTELARLLSLSPTFNLPLFDKEEIPLLTDEQMGVMAAFNKAQYEIIMESLNGS